MSRTITIHFVPSVELTGSLMPMRDFGEDVWKKLRDVRWGTLDLKEVDRATTQFAITDVKASKVRGLVSLDRAGSRKAVSAG